ncbi:MAG: stage III sporulation protein AC [Clostridia bacterium]|nr:stage III sporulation protein AC [Clostridia bacterium]
MDIGLILKVSGIGIIVAIVYQILAKSGREEMGMLVTVAGIIIIFLLMVNELSSLLDTVRSVFGI